MSLCKRKTHLIKVNVSGSDYTVRDQIIATVALGVSRVTEEYPRHKTGGKLVRRGGGDVRVAATTENPETIIGRRGAKKKDGEVRSASECDKG